MLNPYKPPSQESGSLATDRTLTSRDARSAALQGLAVLVVLFALDFLFDETPDLYYNLGAAIAVFVCTLIYRWYNSARKNDETEGRS